MNAISAHDTGLPAGALERLALFAEWTGTTPPARILDGEGEERTFSDDILAYADEQGMSLDWFLAQQSCHYLWHHLCRRTGYEP